MFRRPEDLIVKMPMSLIFNGSRIFGDVSGSIRDFDSGRYFEFGSKIGDALVLATGTSPRIIE